MGPMDGKDFWEWVIHPFQRHSFPRVARYLSDTMLLTTDYFIF